MSEPRKYPMRPEDIAAVAEGVWSEERYRQWTAEVFKGIDTAAYTEWYKSEVLLPAIQFLHGGEPPTIDALR